MEEIVKRQFEKMGCPVTFEPASPRQSNDVAIDIRTSKGKPFFLINRKDDIDIFVADIKPKDRHLLLFCRGTEGIARFLCGHDERHWFVAAVPGGVSSIKEAMEDLKPQEVREAQKSIPKKHQNKRRNKAFLRQGEWFFIPVSEERFGKNPIILDNEPIQRGVGSPHVVEHIIREGGKEIYTCPKYPDGVDKEKYDEIKKTPEAKYWPWRQGRVDATVYGKGKVTHRDHATIHLNGWHQILPNTEQKARGFSHLLYID